MKTWIWIGGCFIAVGAVAAGGVISVRSLSPSPVVQPMAFSHKLHTEEDLSCLDCHKEADKGPYATLPLLKQCLLCHEEAEGEHPDEPKVREYAKERGEIPWIQVNRYAGHVYFSHAAHVKYAEMDCSECHGNMEEETVPVTVSHIEHMGMDMDYCMACHEAKGAFNDCLVCHK